MMYGETFYGRHTAQNQLKKSKINVKKDCLWKKEHTKSRKSETRFDWVSSYATL